MNALRASSVSALLMLAIVGLSIAPASAQLTCVESAVWVDDGQDAGWATGAMDAQLNGYVDVITVAIGETGLLCDALEITVTTADSLVGVPLDFTGNITVDFQEDSGADVRLHFEYFLSIFTGPSFLGHVYVDGVVAQDNIPVTVSGSEYTTTVAKSHFGTTILTGVVGGTSDNDVGFVAGNVPPLYNVDSFSSTTPYIFGVGFDEGGPNDPDSDNDGLPDDWEIEHFSNITAQNGTGDPDGDNLNNTSEYELGTDPNEADTDGDGYNDDVEVAAGTDPNDASDFPVDAADEDGDGLPDDWEIDQFGNITAQNGTGDPDGDGLNNTEEYNAGTNATNPDTDGDTYTDSNEIAEGTDPLDPNSYPGAPDVSDPLPPTDADGDGLDDEWENTHFTNTTAQNGTGDPDGDGCDNECEETNGTDPNNSDSDGDGFDDKAEVDAGSDPNDASSTPDTTTVSEDDDDFVTKLKNDWKYAAAAGGLMLLVVLLGIIALAGRWA